MKPFYFFLALLIAITLNAQEPAASPDEVKPIEGGRTPVESSTVVSIGYDEERKILEVELPRTETEKRRIYQYFDVPKKVHRQLMDAESKGRYFDKHVRYRYKYREVKKKK